MRYRDYLSALLAAMCIGCGSYPSYQHVDVKGRYVVDEKVPDDVKRLYNMIIATATGGKDRAYKTFWNGKKSYTVEAEFRMRRPRLTIGFHDQRGIHIRLYDGDLDGKVDRVSESREGRNFWYYKDIRNPEQFTPLYQKAVQEISKLVGSPKR